MSISLFQTITQYLWNSRISFFVMGALSAVAIMSFALSLGTTSSHPHDWVSDFSQNFSTEMFGAIMTFGLFGILERTKANTTYKETLIRNAFSHINDTAIQSLNEMRQQGSAWPKLE